MRFIGSEFMSSYYKKVYDGLRGARSSGREPSTSKDIPWCGAISTAKLWRSSTAVKSLPLNMSEMRLPDGSLSDRTVPAMCSLAKFKTVS